MLGITISKSPIYCIATIFIPILNSYKFGALFK